MHQQPISQFTKILEQINKRRTKDSKIRYLESHLTDDTCELFWYAYNPLLTYDVSRKELENYAGIISEFHEFDSIYQLLDSLIKKDIVGAPALGAIMGFVEYLSFEDRETFISLVCKEVNIGLSRDDINAVMMGTKLYDWFIPEYDEALVIKDKHKPNKYKLEKVA
jgi:hypothetical protein